MLEDSIHEAVIYRCNECGHLDLHLGWPVHHCPCGAWTWVFLGYLMRGTVVAG